MSGGARTKSSSPPNWLVSGRRRALFLSTFAADEYEVSIEDRARAEGKIDNRVCPFVPLPDTYEEYLSTRVSANTRQKIRRFSRKVEQSADLQLTPTVPITSRSISALFWSCGCANGRLSVAMA